MMAVSALAVANFFIKKSLNEGREHEGLTPMKLLKMIYMAHGVFLADCNKPLIQEDVIAWRYGPVIENVYNAFKHYGNNPITELACDEQGNLYEINPLADDGKVLTVLNAVWDACLDHTAIQLSNWSHEANSPWDITYNKLPGGHFGKLPIKNEVIKDYFQKAA